MKIRDVVVLNEVADDLNGGRNFYDQKEKGIGDYFWDSLISDIESLFIYGGITQQKVWPLPYARKEISVCHLL